MKRMNSQEETNKIHVLQKTPQMKPIHKRAFFIKRDSLSLQRVKRRKASIWILAWSDLKINGETLKILLKAMRPTKAIKRLELHSGFSDDVTVPGFEKFGPALKRLRTLQDLSFDFYQSNWNRLIVEGLCYLCKGVKRLPFLKKLSIHFGEWKNDSNAGFYILGQTLKYLTSLKALDMQIEFESPRRPGLLCSGMCRNKKKRILGKPLKIKSEEPGYIVKSLRNCRNLQIIKLSFCGNSRINEEKFSKALEKLTTLRKIYFFFNSWNMTNNGLLCLSEGLGKLVFLKYLKLHFALCQNVTKEGIARAKEDLEELLPSTEVIVSKWEF